MRISEDELRRLGYEQREDGTWSHKSRIKLDLQSFHPRENPESERAVRHVSTKKNLPKEGSEGVRREGDKYRVVVTCFSWRHRDSDNLSAKVWIDLLRGRVFPDDSSAHVAETVLRVNKVPKTEAEGTLIEVYRI